MNISRIGQNLTKTEVAIPVLYFAGAAGSLAYGTYALINHLRDGHRYSFSNIAKLSAPALVGSGLVFLGVRDLRAGKPLAIEAYEKASEKAQEWMGDEGGRGGRQMRSGGRGSRGNRRGGRRTHASR